MKERVLSKQFFIPVASLLFLLFAFAQFSYGAGANLRKGPYLLFAAKTGTTIVDNTAMTRPYG